jgi:hypothetical protein
LLARFNGQALRSMSLSFRHGFTANFYPPGENESADTNE